MNKRELCIKCLNKSLIQFKPFIQKYFDSTQPKIIWIGYSFELDIVVLSACDYMQSEIRNVLKCWQTIQSSPASSEWLKDNVSMKFQIDTIPSSYVWSVLGTLEWLSQVSSSVRISLIQLNAIVTYCTEWHLRVISCLLFHCCICI